MYHKSLKKFKDRKQLQLAFTKELPGSPYRLISGESKLQISLQHIREAKQHVRDSRNSIGLPKISLKLEKDGEDCERHNQYFAVR